MPVSLARSKKSSRSRGAWSRSSRTRRTTASGTTTPRKSTKSTTGSKMNKMDLLGDGPAAPTEGVAKSQTRHGRSTSYMYGLTVEDIAKSKAKLERSAYAMRKQQRPPLPPPPPPQQKKYQYVALLPKRTTSTEEYSHDDDDYTYGGDTATMATTALPGEAAVDGLVSSLRDMFKCAMPQCSAVAVPTSRGVDKKKTNKPLSLDVSDDEDTCGPPTNIMVLPTPRGTKNKAKQNQFKRKPLMEDMESLVRVRLRTPLGIIFTSIHDGLKGVCIYELPRDGTAYRKAKPSLAVGDELLSINGVDMTHRSLDYVINYIQRVDTSKHKMDLIFRRPSKLGRTRV